ncbi:hypothetical protein OG444_01160 [Streptomyces sp. NBC_01232]|uniref:hypothetical protein n=1 Tax=Streptomyces sp. NBC_01232 TaxID=2903786 RepID=UPI002E14D313|nr:hypothetical protein OG444_01160 [Streptomyces sp. NBC_01232]
MDWELHAIASFAGHRSTESTLAYIHLSGRDLAEKLNRGMQQIHSWRVDMLTRGGIRVIAQPRTAGSTTRPTWASPVDLARYDRRVVLTEAETEALLALGIDQLRRDGLSLAWRLFGRSRGWCGRWRMLWPACTGRRTTVTSSGSRGTRPVWYWSAAASFAGPSGAGQQMTGWT